MKVKENKENKVTKLIMPYVLVLAGSVLYAAGFQFFLYPNSIVVGGLTGISMIINYLTGLPVGVMVIIMNIPLFMWAWKKFGFNFMLMSLLGTFISSALVDVFAMLNINITDQPLLASIYGGLIKGAGLGLIYQANGTTGGVDIIAKFLRQKYRHINFGTLLLMLDVVVIFAFAVCFSKYDSGMYSIIAMFIASQVVDLVLYGAVNSKVCYIISDSSDTIKNAITGRLGRGVTLLHGEGAYSGREKQVIMCVIKQQQIVEIRQIIKEFDENAFVIISDSHEVFGKGFTSIHDNK